MRQHPPKQNMLFFIAFVIGLTSGTGEGVSITRDELGKIHTFTPHQRQQALDRLVEYYRIQDEQKAEKQKRAEEYRQWQKTPIVEWNVYFGFIFTVFMTTLCVSIYSVESYSVETIVQAFIMTVTVTLMAFCFSFIIQAKIEF